MIKKFIGTILLGGGMLFAQAPATPTPQPAQQVQPKPDTSSLIKARLHAFKAQQKQSYSLAKAQTKVALEQLKMQQVNDKTNKQIAVETAKAGK